jgi:DNA-binding NarL/FixJ family response regulator
LWLEDRSRHHAAVGDPGEAARLLVDAARRDLAAQSPASAEVRLRQSLDLAPTGDVAAAARDALADALTALGRWEQALRLDEEELAGGRVTPRRLLRMARSSLRTGRLDAAGALLERAAAVGAQTTRVDALSGLVALWRGDLERARERASAVLQAAEPKDAEVLCDALDVFGRASDMLGRRPEAVAAFERWIETAERAGLTASRLQALMEFGNVEFMSTYASDRLREARRMAEQAGAYTTLVLADLSLVWCLGATADLAEAVALGQEAVELARRFELDILPHALEALGWVLGRRAHGSGDALIDEAVRLAPGDADILVQAHDARGDVAMRAGAFTEALHHFDAALDVIRSNPAVVPMATPSMRVCALIACGREHEASAALHEARELSPNPRLLIVPIWLDAAAALVAGAPAALELAVPPQTTPRYERATILVVAAQAFDGSQAVAWLREALTIYDDAGAGDDAARVRRLMRGRGAPVPRARRQAAAPEESLRSRGVTRREAEVLELVRRGRSNAEIARGLFLSVRTVESHVSSLLAKLGVHSRPALIALAASVDAVSNGAQ